MGFKNNGKLKLLIIVGTRPEIIRLSEVIKKCRKYFDVILAHTGQNYDYTLNGVFFKDLSLDDPEVYMDAVGDDLGATMGNIIDKSYKLMVDLQPDAVLVLGDTNSCLSVIGAKRLHIPIFHMEAGNRCKDECLPEETNRRIVDIISDVNLAYSEHARRYLAECGLPKERTYVTGSPMAEVLRANLDKIELSDVHERLGLEKGKYILLSAHREENIDTEKNFESLFTAINKMESKNLRATFENLDIETFEKVTEDLINAKRIYVIGFRSCAPLVQFMVYYLGYIFDNVHQITIGTSDIYSQLVHVNEGDVVIGMAFPRYSSQTVEGVKFAKERHAKIITITDNNLSPLYNLSDHCILTKNNINSFVDSFVAPLSIINTMIILVGLKKKDVLTENYSIMENIWREKHVYAVHDYAPLEEESSK